MLSFPKEEEEEEPFPSLILFASWRFFSFLSSSSCMSFCDGNTKRCFFPLTSLYLSLLSLSLSFSTFSSRTCYSFPVLLSCLVLLLQPSFSFQCLFFIIFYTQSLSRSFLVVVVLHLFSVDDRGYWDISPEKSFSCLTCLSFDPWHEWHRREETMPFVSVNEKDMRENENTEWMRDMSTDSCHRWHTEEGDKQSKDSSWKLHHYHGNDFLWRFLCRSLFCCWVWYETPTVFSLVLSFVLSTRHSRVTVKRDQWKSERLLNLFLTCKTFLSKANFAASLKQISFFSCVERIFVLLSSRIYLTPLLCYHCWEVTLISLSLTFPFLFFLSLFSFSDLKILWRSRTSCFFESVIHCLAFSFITSIVNRDMSGVWDVVL